VNEPLSSLREEMRQGFADMRAEMRQGFIEARTAKDEGLVAVRGGSSCDARPTNLSSP
jgi:hypothetical protein